MVYGKMSAQKVKELSLSINDIVRRVAEENASLQEITKEYTITYHYFLNLKVQKKD